jgi:rhamnose transport system permease protein
MRHVGAARAVYATGSNMGAARVAGINTTRVKVSVFAVAGALTGLAAVVNAVRFNQIPSNSGLGLEMKVIAAVVVGGAAIRGGSATFTGTFLGVVLLGAIGPALVSWRQRLLGARDSGPIILAAVAWTRRR